MPANHSFSRAQFSVQSQITVVIVAVYTAVDFRQNLWHGDLSEVNENRFLSDERLVTSEPNSW
uniref:Uncharacterized protein n=1 Tax=Glossina brevipalpis TaxID=37001 RepID=A0A1A9WZ72_9MUSC